MRHESKVMAAVWIALGLLLFAWCPVQGQGDSPAQVQEVEEVGRYSLANPRVIEKSDRFYDLAMEAEDCVKMAADYTKIRLRLVDYIDYERANGDLEPISGLYWPVTKTITIPKYLYNHDWLVKHEIIHFILFQNGIGERGSPNEALHAPYIQRCAPTPIGW